MSSGKDKMILLRSQVELRADRGLTFIDVTYESVAAKGGTVTTKQSWFFKSQPQAHNKRLISDHKIVLCKLEGQNPSRLVYHLTKSSGARPKTCNLI